MTLDQIGMILQVHYRTVKRWIKAGKLPCVRIGLLYRVKRSDFEKFVNKDTTA